MKYVIWGASHRGRILYELLGKERIAAYIDSDPAKRECSFKGCPVIDYDTYKEQYKEYVVIISMVFGGGVTDLLERDHIFYFSLEKCPPEFMGYGLSRARQTLSGKKLSIPDNLILYGSTLYTVLVYEKLQAEGYENISVFLPSHMNEEKRVLFSQVFPDICIVRTCETEGTTVLLTEKVKHLETEVNSAFVIDIVDWTLYVPEYHNDRIESLKDGHKGKRCFIVATGPSVTYDDLECLNKNQEFCISMNSIFTCFPNTKWRPECYVLLDADGVLVWKDEFHKLKDVPYKFIADCHPYFDYASLEDIWFVYHSILDDFSIKNMLFSDDFSRKVYNGSTVTYVCIQLAVYLGFKEIYLLGVDYNYSPNTKNHFTDQREPDDVFDGINGQNRIQDISYTAFQKAKEYASEHGIKIINATKKTQLDVFEQVEFETLFCE